MSSVGRTSVRRVAWFVRTWPKVPAICLAACLLALLTATPGHASGSITLRAYAKRADAVCATYHRKAAKLPLVQMSDFQGLVKLVRADLPLVATANKGLRAIPLPAAERSLVKAWLRRGYRVPALLKALERAAQNKSLTQVGAANQALQANGARRRSLARRLGMRACSRG
jgi:hypothetical protein